MQTGEVTPLRRTQCTRRGAAVPIQTATSHLPRCARSVRYPELPSFFSCESTCVSFVATMARGKECPCPTVEHGWHAGPDLPASRDRVRYFTALGRHHPPGTAGAPTGS